MPYKNITDMPPQCPPANAVSQDVAPVYRFIEDETPCEKDFLNHKELGLPYPDHKACEALALSMYTTEEAAIAKKKKIKRLRKHKIANGKITQQCGSFVVDEEQHMSLWLFRDVNMLKIFMER